MAMIYIPPQLKSLADGVDCIQIDEGNIRRVITRLEEQFPGVRDRLCQDDELRPGLSVSVNGRISSLGLYQKVQPQDEIHFIPAIGGG